ncbi:MAG: putative porin [Elusimicrobia bacterium]|nr:putative porin [Elusimicrobiota bacterium]
MQEIKTNCSYKELSTDIWLSQIILKRRNLENIKNNRVKEKLNLIRNKFSKARGRVKKTAEYVMGGNIREGLLLTALLFIPVLSLSAGEIDILTDKLVEKNILSPIEAQIMLDETRQAVAGELNNGMSYAAPKWTQKMTFKGDLRLRYQYNNKNGAQSQHRGRYRLRLGGESTIKPDLKVAFGLASGGTDPRSTNQTMSNTFESSDIRLDYAFSQYAMTPWLTFYGGKFTRKLAFLQLSDLLWDSDINPEGGALAVNRGMGYNFDLLFNAGWFILDESSSDTSDPSMYIIQPGFQWEIDYKRKIRFAVAYYDFNAVKGDSLSYSQLTNTLSGGNYVYDYNIFNPSLEYVFINDENLLMPYYAVFGEYVYNGELSKNNKGYLLGLTLGHLKVAKQRQWQFKYTRRRLEKDAWLDTFPDSDFYSGKTGVKGNEIVFEYALADNVIFGADYYNARNIGGAKKTEDLLQVDLNFKF